MIKERIAIPIVVFILFASISAQPKAAPANTLTVAADEWCPYNCAPNSVSPGFIIEVLEAVFSEHNMKIDYRILPWKRAIKETEEGIIDAAVGAVEGDHGRTILGKENLGLDETVFIVRKDYSLNYTGTASLDNMVMGVVADYTYDNQGEIDRYIETRKRDNRNIYTVHQEYPLKSLFNMLVSGRIDIFPENKYVSAYQATSMGVNDKIAYIPTGAGDKVYVAFSPTERGRQNTIKLDEGIRKLRKNGKLSQLFRKYGIQ